MAVLDAYAVIAVLRDEPAAEEVRPLLLTGSASIAAPNVAETYDKVLRATNLTIEELDDLIGRLHLSAIPTTDVIARRAGQLRAHHYSRAFDVSLADCIALATAEQLSDSLATPDRYVVDIARSIGVDVIALPDSAGNRA